MNRNYVIINGVNSLTIKGLAINLMPPITKPLMRTMREEIDGRNGDINTELGYQAYDKQIEVGLYGNYDIDEIIAFFNSKGTIVFSDENDKFYNFQILDKIDFAKMVKFRTAMINIHCQPFKYPLTDTPVDVAYDYVESTGENLTLDNTEASSLKMDLKGNTSQTTISGKNLFDIATNTSDNYAVNNNISSISGNTMVLNGAGGASSRVIRLQNQVANKTYTVSFNTDINTNRILVRIRKSDDSGWLTNSDITWSGWTYNTTYSAWYYSANASNNKATFTFAVPSGLYWQLGIVNVNSTSATFSNIQLEEGSSATAYVPYVGGTDSPNPQFPQPVNVVSGDNEINICGKNLLYSSFYQSSANGIKCELLNFPSGTFTWSFTNQNIPGEIQVKTKVNGSYQTYVNAYSTNKLTFTLDTPQDIQLESYRAGGNPLENYSNMMIERGSTITTYEPYIGNTYPIYLGVENLFDISNVNNLALSDTIVSNPSYRGYSLKVNPSETYTISRSTTSSPNRFRVCFTKVEPANGVPFYGENGTAQGYVELGSSISGTIIVPNEMSYMFIYLSNSNQTITTEMGIQIEKGSKANHPSTTPIELCKIGTYQDKIYKGKGYNLLENTNTTQTINGITFTKNDNGSVKLSGTSNAVADYYLKGSASDYVDLDLPSGSYNLSGCINGSGSTYMLYVVQNRNGSLTYLQSINTTGLNITIQNGDTFRIFIRVMSGQTPNTTIFPMINEGTTPLPYEPYNAKDKWLLHKEIGKVVSNGSENWSTRTSSVGQLYELNVSSYNFYSTQYESLGFCNQYKPLIYLTEDNTFRILQGVTLGIHNDTIGNLTNFKNGLANNNLIVYFPLAIPTATEITEEQLVEQLNAIQNAVSYNGTTYIAQENSDKPFMIDATALKKGSDTAVLNNIGNIYSKPIMALKGTGIVNIYNDGVQAFQVDMSEENDITIDTEMMEAYTPTKLANRQVTGDYSKFMIDTGSHDVKFDGELTEATITRYVRWL